jgi:hypothetical protein
MDDYSAGINGRSDQDFGLTVRPRTEKSKDEFERRYPGKTYSEQLEMYFRENVAHNYKDPSAQNKPLSTLKEEARDTSGAPHVWFEFRWAGPLVTGLKWHVKYPNYERDGTEIVGESDDGILDFGSPIPTVVCDFLSEKLRIK